MGTQGLALDGPGGRGRRHSRDEAIDTCTLEAVKHLATVHAVHHARRQVPGQVDLGRAGQRCEGEGRAAESALHFTSQGDAAAHRSSAMAADPYPRTAATMAPLTVSFTARRHAAGGDSIGFGGAARRGKCTTLEGRVTGPARVGAGSPAYAGIDPGLGAWRQDLPRTWRSARRASLMPALTRPRPTSLQSRCLRTACCSCALRAKHE